MNKHMSGWVDEWVYLSMDLWMEEWVGRWKMMNSKASIKHSVLLSMHACHGFKALNHSTSLHGNYPRLRQPSLSGNILPSFEPKLP